MFTKSLFFMLCFIGTVTVSAAALNNSDPTDQLDSRERKDFLSKISSIPKEVPKDTPLFLILGSSWKDSERHHHRHTLYSRSDVFHMSNEDVEFEILESKKQFWRANFNNFTATWLMLERLFPERFKKIYFDWSTFKLFRGASIDYLNKILERGGQVYVPELFDRLPNIEERKNVRQRPGESEEENNSRWEEYKKEWSLKLTSGLFTDRGFEIKIVSSDSIHDDPIFEEIKLNNYYIEHPEPFNVLIATKIRSI